MKDFMLHTAKTSVAVSIESDHIWVSNGEMNSNNKSYNLSFDHYQKLKSYKSVSALLKYAKANQIAPVMQEAQIETTHDGAFPLASDLSEQANNAPSDFVACESGVNPPPVAVSSYPAASDTLFVLSKYPQACSQCHTLLSDINTSDLNPICNACLWFSEEVDETDLYEDDRDKTYPLELPKPKTKPSCLAVLS